MYSQEQRKTAIQLYIKYNKRIAPVISELGYPSRQLLPLWYIEYKNEQEGKFKSFVKKNKYTIEERNFAIHYYLSHGKNITDTARTIGYPSRNLLSKWVNEDVKSKANSCVNHTCLVRYTQKEKDDAIIDLTLRTGSAEDICKKRNISRGSIYKWRKLHLSSNGQDMMNTRNEIPKEGNEDLKTEVVKLKEQIDKIKLEKDILEQAIKLIKKEVGIDIRLLTNKEKTIIINALRSQYSLYILLNALFMSKSSYCYQNKVFQKGDKYKQIRITIKELFAENYNSYGSQRIYLELKKVNIHISEKVVRRLMKEEGLIIASVRTKKYSSYLGEIGPAVENLVNKDFFALEPNTKMLTDITEFAIPAGKVYLSPLVDCFDGLIASWSISTTPNADLVNTMLETYIETLNPDQTPLIHSDRGSHYRWPRWIEIMKANNLTRSMSKKGCSAVNSACEGFFGRMKNEMFYHKDWKGVTIEEFMNEVSTYINWYNHQRIKVSLNELSPVEHRRSLGKV